MSTWLKNLGTTLGFLHTLNYHVKLTVLERSTPLPLVMVSSWKPHGTRNFSFSRLKRISLCLHNGNKVFDFIWFFVSPPKFEETHMKSLLHKASFLSRFWKFSEELHSFVMKLSKISFFTILFAPKVQELSKLFPASLLNVRNPSIMSATVLLLLPFSFNKIFLWWQRYSLPI